ncbi:MAG: DUF3703 domain-containing protein [Ilumatobacteraceae bacterium]
MGRMTDEIRARIDSLLVEAKECRRHGDWDCCWQHLEDAHVLSQPWALPHTRVHAAMLATGLRSRDVREVGGQILRLIVGGPASAVGRYPTGNTGRARVPATRPMPIRPDLADVLRRAGRGES